MYIAFSIRHFNGAFQDSVDEVVNQGRAYVRVLEKSLLAAIECFNLCTHTLELARHISAATETVADADSTRGNLLSFLDGLNESGALLKSIVDEVTKMFFDVRKGLLQVERIIINYRSDTHLLLDNDERVTSRQAT